MPYFASCLPASARFPGHLATEEKVTTLPGQTPYRTAPYNRCSSVDPIPPEHGRPLWVWEGREGTQSQATETKQVPAEWVVCGGSKSACSASADWHGSTVAHEGGAWCGSPERKGAHTPLPACAFPLERMCGAVACVFFIRDTRAAGAGERGELRMGGRNPRTHSRIAAEAPEGAIVRNVTYRIQCSSRRRTELVDLRRAAAQ